MKIAQTLFVFALMLLFLACSNSPVVPAEKNTPDIPVIWTEIGMLPLVPEDYRGTQAVVPGTDMTIDQLKCYFTVSLIKTTFPYPFYWGLVCPFIKPVIYYQTAETVLSWIPIMESNGVDIPTAAQAQAGGWLTPIC